MSGIVYAAENKQIDVSIECPEDLTVAHDSKWTTEALFNLLDNAVKYTPAGGKIDVTVEQWEMYLEIKVTDTGKGISESNQAAIFRRFYREEEVHEQPALVSVCIWLVRLLHSKAVTSKWYRNQGKALPFLLCFLCVKLIADSFKMLSPTIFGKCPSVVTFHPDFH